MGTSFYRAAKDKCPNCGDFGVQEDEYRRCPACETCFNEYMVIEEGMDVGFQNN